MLPIEGVLEPVTLYTLLMHSYGHTIGMYICPCVQLHGWSLVVFNSKCIVNTIIHKDF